MNVSRLCRTLKSREFALYSDADCPEDIALIVLHGDSGLSVQGGLACCVLVLKGVAEIQSLEGRFVLTRRRRMVLDMESLPQIRCLRGALACLLIYRPAALTKRRDLHTELPLPGIDAFDHADLAWLRQLQTLLGNGHSTETQTIDKRLVEHILLRLLPQPDQEQRQWLMRCPGRTLTRKRQVLARLQRARLHIEGHPERVQRLAELAEITRFSPWHFSKAFQGVYGMSPQHYGKSTRLDHARRLLSDEQLSISEIAAASGFDNPSSFARAFHGRFGASATAIRSGATAC